MSEPAKEGGTSFVRLIDWDSDFVDFKDMISYTNTPKGIEIMSFYTDYVNNMDHPVQPIGPGLILSRRRSRETGNGCRRKCVLRLP